MTTSPTAAIDQVLALLDCPTCHQQQGLVPQQHEGREYLACPRCEFWYPIVNEVFVLLPSDRVEGGLRRPLGPETRCSVAVGPRRTLDVKAAVYSYFVRMHELCAEFDVQREPLVVDVGCSTGSFSCALAPDQVYFGLDISLRSLTFARRSTGHFFAQADAERLPLKTRGVPFFISREVLEHLNDPAAGARELRRSCARGIVETPNLDFPFLYDPLNYLLTRVGKRARFGIYGYDHNELLDARGWRTLLESAEFRTGREAPIGTGLALNGSDLVWHTLLSWRKFDGLPRREIDQGSARRLFKAYRALHRVDGPLYRQACSRAYEVA